MLTVEERYAQKVRDAVILAKAKTAGFQSKVTRLPFLEDDVDNDPTYGTPQVLDAVIELKQQQVQSHRGDSVISSATLTFFDSVSFNVRDKLSYVLNGAPVSAPILNFGGPMDPATGRPFLTQVFVGSGADVDRIRQS